MPYATLRNLPALRWKLVNLEKLKTAKPKQFAQQHALLAERFGE